MGNTCRHHRFLYYVRSPIFMIENHSWLHHKFYCIIWAPGILLVKFLASCTCRRISSINVSAAVRVVPKKGVELASSTLKMERNFAREDMSKRDSHKLSRMRMIGMPRVKSLERRKKRENASRQSSVGTMQRSCICNATNQFCGNK